MTGAFVSALRAAPGALNLADGPGTLSVRVQSPDYWDAVRVIASPDTPVAVVKDAALRTLHGGDAVASEFLLKLNGFELFDEGASLREAGAADGSTLLLLWRRRRPVR